MFQHITMLRELQHTRETLRQLQGRLTQTQADLAYLAVMSDVRLPEFEEKEVQTNE